MLVLTEKPKTFREMVGQELVKKSLLKISKNPETSPRIILLSGEYGTGKTLASKIFTSALNCPNKLADGDACGKEDCPICGQKIEESMFYEEYDSAIVGNVDTIKELRGTFYFGYTKGYKVIVLDECQLISKTAQGALLKIFEHPEPNVFFIICTTDQDKLLQTIVSRSLVLCYNKINYNDIEEYLHKIVNKYSQRCSELSTDEVDTNIKLIARKSQGHIRNALMLLDNMFLLGKDFKNLIKDIRPHYLELLSMGLNYNDYIKRFDKNEVDKNISRIINDLLYFPISELKTEYELLVLDISKYIFNINSNNELDSIISKFRNNIKLFNILNDKVIYNLFTDDIQFQIAMLILIKNLSSLKINNGG